MHCVLIVSVRVLAAAALVAAVAQAGEPSTLEKASEEHKALFAEIRPLILQEAKQPPLVLAESDESYFWIMSARLVPLMDAYAYSKDPAFLDAFVPLMEQVLSQRYIHPTKPEWNGWFGYKGFDHLALIDHDAILYFVPVLKFVKEVRVGDALRARYGQKAEAWFADVEVSIRNWDKRGCWHDLGEQGGWYSTVTHCPDPSTGELVPINNVQAGSCVPYNKIHALFEALGLAYRMTGDPWYRGRMEKCCHFFRSHWRVDDRHAEWNYRDHAFASDYGSGVLGQGPTKTGAFIHPKGGYYTLDASGVVQAYDLGVFYSRADIEKLVQTNLQFMWMGDSQDPKFKKIDGDYEESGKYNKGVLWTALAHFSDTTRSLWRTRIELARKSGGWMWWGDMLDYLTETSQPVSWEPRYVKELQALRR
jgi:hypothetical protein